MNEEQSYALILAYDGTDFAGYARQSNPPQRTVQGELEAALATALHLPERSERPERLEGPLQTVVAGRTDAGVHASGQVVSFTSPEVPPGLDADPTFLRSLNALTPRDISVRAIQAVPPGFSARFDAVEREYRYRIATAVEPPLFMQRYAWHLPGFAGAASSERRARLAQAAAALIGEHDFSSFAVTASLEGKNPVRTLRSIDLVEATVLGEPLTEIRIVGTAFLHSMVRVIVGTLVDIDAGRLKPDALPAILAACDRSAAGQTAPARGLTFWGVTYPQFSSALLPQ
ncbi:MAG: tRNA pseudouridine(38-40) synthase TruA [Coriobacteriia bacterium]|nr:tRNA pseudouridine(38-40) synthase TruA [Coriobacteriia bacterium]